MIYLTFGVKIEIFIPCYINNKKNSTFLRCCFVLRFRY